MTTISAAQVKELRDLTGAGFVECKKALEASGGDVQLAIDNMRKAGMAKAAKKASRTTAEGVIIIELSSDHRTAFMIEVNSETDFVARDHSFLEFAHTVAKQGLSAKAKSVEELNGLSYPGAHTIEEKRQELVAKIGENIQIRRAILIEAPQGSTIGAYRHGEKIAALVQLQGGDQQLGKDIAMHIVANNPQALAPKDVASELIAREKEIFTEQAKGSGKPAAIIEKMVEGRIQKFLSEISLLEQPYIRDPNQTVANLVKAHHAQIVQFVRFQVGEGIEKKTVNFAEEVRAQVEGSRS